jgi:hypothetical protein
MISAPGETFVRLPNKSLNSVELPCGLEEHGWGRSVKVQEAFVKSLRKAQTQAVLQTEWILLPIHMFKEVHRNYNREITIH